MGNCHFKTDFDAENITGKFNTLSHSEPLLLSKANNKGFSNNAGSFGQIFRAIYLQIYTIAVSKSSFVYQFCIGKGGFGKVWKVDRKKSKQEYAMKEMSKARILTKRSVKSVMNER
jgi:hypothetical protein